MALHGRVGVVVKEDQFPIAAKLFRLHHEARTALMLAPRDHL